MESLSTIIPGPEVKGAHTVRVSMAMGCYQIFKRSTAVPAALEDFGNDQGLRNWIRLRPFGHLLLSCPFTIHGISLSGFVKGFPASSTIYGLEERNIP